MKKIPPFIISICAAILLIAIAYRLDYWTSELRQSISQREFGAGQNLAWTWMVSTYFAVLLLVSFLLLWLWFTQRQVQKHAMLCLLYVVLGAIMPLYSLVMMGISMRLNSPLFVVYFPIAPLSLASFASAFITGFGLQRLIFRQSAL
jgi:hypothetical protein